MKSYWRSALVSLVVLLTLAGAAGWYLAIVRASELEVARNALHTNDIRIAALVNEKTGLQQTVGDLNGQLAGAQQGRAQAQAALAAARHDMADTAALKAKLADANNRADATTAQLEALRHQAASRTEATTHRTTAPTFDLPATASVRDYLSVSDQAIRSGDLPKARSALGRAEVRALNAGQLNGPPTARERARSHAIQHAIDLLKAGHDASARRLIEALMSERQEPTSQ